mmetsp:Transcript_54255/g.101333  ORF Transcript_54255/g.101333 Transcript_54255/m.101333 type:complete len:227 (-) Transcript_54255:240-920(-)
MSPGGAIFLSLTATPPLMTAPSKLMLTHPPVSHAPMVPAARLRRPTFPPPIHADKGPMNRNPPMSPNEHEVTGLVMAGAVATDATAIPGKSAPASTTQLYCCSSTSASARDGSQNPMKNPLRSRPVLKPIICVFVFGFAPSTTFMALEADTNPAVSPVNITGVKSANDSIVAIISKTIGRRRGIPIMAKAWSAMRTVFTLPPKNAKNKPIAMTGMDATTPMMRSMI